MAANARIIQQGEGLSVLQDLIALVQDPKLIAEAHKTYRAELKLTDAEEVKALEARKFIAEYDVKFAALSEAEDIIETARQNFEETSVKKNSELDTKAAAIKSQTAELKVQAALQAEVTKEQAIEAKRIASAEIDMQEYLAEQQRRLDIDRAFVEKTNASNISKAIELEDVFADLKIRIKKVELREQAADL